VAEHCGSSGAPIREVYLVGPPTTSDPTEFRTEVCWPITDPNPEDPT
jgi:effector-binding domain-containing protein